MKALFAGKRLRHILLGLLLFAAICFSIFYYSTQTTRAANIVWDGGGATNNWSEGANWAGDTPPGTSDVAVFDATSTKDATIDTAIDVRGVLIEATYTGEISQAAEITTGESDWNQNGGTFTGGSQTITNTGQLDLNAGTFTSTSGTYTLGEDFEFNASSSNTAVFNHNNGTFIFAMESNEQMYGIVTFYDVEINSPGSRQIFMRGTGGGPYIKTVENSLTLTNGALGISGSVTDNYMVLNGTFSHASTFDGGTGRIDLTTDIDIVASDGDVYPGFGFLHASSSFTGAGGGTTVTIEGPINVGVGTFTAGDGIVEMQDLTVAATSTFDPGNGTIEISFVTATWDVDSTLTVNNLDISETFRPDASDTIIVSGELTLNDSGSISEGTVRADGTITIPGGTEFFGGDGELDINCACALTTTGVGGYALPGVTMSDAGASITNADTILAFDGDVDLQTGTFNASANTTEFRKDFNIEPAATFNHDNGTVQFQSEAFGTPFSTTNISGDLTLYNLEFFNEYSNYFEFESSSSYEVENELQIDHSDEQGTHAILKSDIDGTQVDFDFQVDSTVNDMQFQDINNTGAGTITCLVRCLDSGNNDGLFDIDQPGVSIGDPSNDSVTEAGSTATVDVTLDHRPTGTVTISAISGDTSEVTVSPASLSFTSANYATAQSFTLTGEDDSVDDGPIETEIQFIVSSAPADADYVGIDLETQSISTTDDDTTTASFDFDDSTNYEEEDVKDTGSAVIDYYDTNFNEGITFFDVGDVEIDISSSKIRAGCTMMLDDDFLGTGIYEIVSIIDASVGQIQASENTGEFDLGTFPESGEVLAIWCTNVDAGGQLNQTWHNTRKLIDGAADRHALVYDSVHDAIWSYDADTFLDVVKIDESTLTREVQLTLDPEVHAGFDSSRGNVWWTKSDEVIAYDGTGEDFLNGTEGSSTFSADRIFNEGTYDPTQDRMWFGSTRDTMILYGFDASDGTLDVSLDTGIDSDGSEIGGTTYDSSDNAIWIYDDNNGNLVKADATDGTAFDTNFTTSSYSIEPYWNDRNDFGYLHYDPTNDIVYGTEGVCEGEVDFSDTLNGHVFSVNADDGDLLEHIPILNCPFQSSFNSTTRLLHSNHFIESGPANWVNILNVDTRTSEAYVGAVSSGEGLAVDSENDVWIPNGFYDELWEFVYDGVPTNEYYTIVSDAGAQLDSSLETGIDSITVDEVDDGESVFYTISFDGGQTYEVWGSDRPVASDRDAITGLGDGTWAYRDNGSTWSAAPENNAASAISAAVAAGANNQMTGTELASLDESDFNTMGFTAGTLDVAATLHASDPHNNPRVNSLTVTYAGAGGIPPTTTSSGVDASISIQAEACSPDRDILVRLTGDNVQDYLLSEDADFTDADWLSFEPNVSELADTMDLLFELSEGDGEKTLYTKARSGTLNQTGVASIVVELDTAGGCIDPEEPEEDPEEPELISGCLDVLQLSIPTEELNAYRFGVSPMTGLYSTAEMVRPGDMIRSLQFDTVYCVDENLERRPYIDEISFFSHERTFTPVRWVTDEALAAFKLGNPILPNPRTILVKFESSPEVYIHEFIDGAATEASLAWITTEELAAYLVGADWADYVIDLNPTLFTYYDLRAPIINVTEIDTSEFRRRQLLNERNADQEDRSDVYFTRTRRISRASFARQ